MLGWLYTTIFNAQQGKQGKMFYIALKNKLRIVLNFDLQTCFERFGKQENWFCLEFYLSFQEIKEIEGYGVLAA